MFLMGMNIASASRLLSKHSNSMSVASAAAAATLRANNETLYVFTMFTCNSSNTNRTNWFSSLYLLYVPEVRPRWLSKCFTFSSSRLLLLLLLLLLLIEELILCLDQIQKETTKNNNKIIATESRGNSSSNNAINAYIIICIELLASTHHLTPNKWECVRRQFNSFRSLVEQRKSKIHIATNERRKNRTKRNEHILSVDFMDAICDIVFLCSRCAHIKSKENRNLYSGCDFQSTNTQHIFSGWYELEKPFIEPNDGACARSLFVRSLLLLTTQHTRHPLCVRLPNDEHNLHYICLGYVVRAAAAVTVSLCDGNDYDAICIYLRRVTSRLVFEVDFVGSDDMGISKSLEDD